MNGKSDSRSRTPSRSVALWVGTGILVLAAILRLYHLESREFNLDEAYSFVFGRDYSFSEVVSPTSSLNAGDRHPTLHYALVWVWERTAYPLLRLAGLGMEGAFRCMSVLIGLLSVVVVMVCGRRLGGGWVAAWAGLLMATSAFSVGVAQEARMYSMVECAGACLLAAMLGCRDDVRPGWWSLALLVAASWFLMASHYCGIIFTAAAWGWLFVAYRPWRGRLLLGGVILAILYAYWVIGFIVQLAAEQSGAGSGIKFSTGLVIPFTYFSFLAGETLLRIKLLADLLPALPWIVAAMLVAGLGLGGLWMFWREEPARRPWLLMVLWLMVVPMLLMWVGSFKVHKLFLSVHYAMAALAPFLVLLAVGLAHCRTGRRVWVAVLAGVGYLVINAMALGNQYTLRGRPYTPWREVAAYLIEVKPAALAVYSPYMACPLSLYQAGIPVIPLPEERVGSWSELERRFPELGNARTNMVLMITHPKKFEDQYLGLFSERSPPCRLSRQFEELDFWLKRPE